MQVMSKTHCFFEKKILKTKNTVVGTYHVPFLESVQSKINYIPLLRKELSNCIFLNTIYPFHAFFEIIQQPRNFKLATVRHWNRTSDMRKNLQKYYSNYKNLDLLHTLLIFISQIIDSGLIYNNFIIAKACQFFNSFLIKLSFEVILFR